MGYLYGPYLLTILSYLAPLVQGVGYWWVYKHKSSFNQQFPEWGTFMGFAYEPLSPIQIC
jgi:hypothetical protein